MATVAATNHPKTATKSGLWQFFTLVSQGHNKVYNCNICKAKFVQQGNIVSTLTSHLKTRHPQCVKTAPSSVTIKHEPDQIKAQGTSSTGTSGTEKISGQKSSSNPNSNKPSSNPNSNKPSSNPNSTSSKSKSHSTSMTSATPTKAKDKERIVKLLHESILHLCKVSVSGPGDIEVDGIVCITQPNDSDIVVKVHETFSNVHNSENKDEEGKSPLPGEKRKAGSHGEGNKTPRKDSTGERQKTPVSRRLMGSDETLDLTGDDEGTQKQHRSPHRARNSKSDVIDLTSGRDTPAPQLHITQVRSLGNQPQQRFNGPSQYNQRFVNYRPRGAYPQQRPRQRFIGRGNMAPPPSRNMNPNQAGGNVVPISGPIPHRSYAQNQNPNTNIMGPRGPGQSQMAPVNTNVVRQTVPPNGAGNMNSRGGPDVSVHGYKGLKCKYKDCGFSCSNKYYLETHVLQHFDSSPFSCNEESCDFKTKNKQNLYQHYKLAHGANNPQFCFKCIKAFKSPEALNIHAQNCQVMSIRCDHCGENILGLMAMARHLTEVYIADSTSSDGQTAGQDNSPGSTPSPGQANQGTISSPGHSAQSSLQSPSGVPDMSAPLNIIPDLTAMSSQHTSQGDLIHQELEKLEQMSTDMQQQQQQQQQQQENQQNAEVSEAVTKSQLPSFRTTDDLSQTVRQPSDTPPQQPVSTPEHFSAPQLPQFEVLNQPITTQDQEPITLQVPVDMNADLSLPPGAEAITLELVPLISNDTEPQSQDKSPDIAS